MDTSKITPDLAKKLISSQFPEYSDLEITPVKHQGHDNRTYRLGKDMLIRLPIAESYALKIQIEQDLLPQLSQHLSLKIPEPIRIGMPTEYYPYPFSIYRWIEGESANHLQQDDKTLESTAYQLANFLKELQSIDGIKTLPPGQHNWWRGEHISIYHKSFREQVSKLKNIIDSNKAISLWEKASKTQWKQNLVWIHGDFSSGNILIKNNHLAAVIDFGGMATGDPACDLVIAWTYLDKKARDIFIKEMHLDEDTWLRAKAWALWKAMFELSHLTDKKSPAALLQKSIITNILNQ